jgi:hypothetical protein
MSADSSLGWRLARYWFNPNDVTARITQTKVCSASILRVRYDAPLAIGGFHVDR